MLHQLKRLIPLTLCLSILACTGENTGNDSEEETEINAMDSSSKAIEDSTERLEDETRKVEEALEKLDKEFDSSEIK